MRGEGLGDRGEESTAVSPQSTAKRVQGTGFRVKETIHSRQQKQKELLPFVIFVLSLSSWASWFKMRGQGLRCRG